jgi:hypothetical protein
MHVVVHDELKIYLAIIWHHHAIQCHWYLFVIVIFCKINKCYIRFTTCYCIWWPLSPSLVMQLKSPLLNCVIVNAFNVHCVKDCLSNKLKVNLDYLIIENKLVIASDQWVEICEFPMPTFKFWIILGFKIQHGWNLKFEIQIHVWHMCYCQHLFVHYYLIALICDGVWGIGISHDLQIAKCWKGLKVSYYNLLSFLHCI